MAVKYNEFVTYPMISYKLKVAILKSYELAVCSWIVFLCTLSYMRRSGISRRVLNIIV